MKNLEKLPTQSKADGRTLTDYWWQQREVGRRAVEEMSKHPLSFHAAKAQIEARKAFRPHDS